MATADPHRFVMPVKLTDLQLRMLRVVAGGGRISDVTMGRSQAGGATGSMTSLVRLGLFQSGGGITDAGKAQLELRAGAADLPRLSAQQSDILCHTIGIPLKPRRWQISRNFFSASPGHNDLPDLEALVGLKMMAKVDYAHEVIYWCTPRGIGAALASRGK